MKSIFTKFLPVTNHKGSRIKAFDSDRKNSITISYDHALNSDGNHMAVARKLAEKLGWSGQWIEGSAGNTGYVYVLYNDARYSFMVDSQPRTK